MREGKTMMEKDRGKETEKKREAEEERRKEWDTAGPDKLRPLEPNCTPSATVK